MQDGVMPGRTMLLTTDAVGGVWRYTIDLARGLSALGVRCVVAVLGPPPDAGQAAEARMVPGLELVRTGLPLDWTAADAGALAGVSERLAALAALLGAGSVHLHAPALLGCARWPAPVVAVGHSCVGTWWRAVRGGSPTADFAWRMAATAAGLRGAAAVIAPSAAHAAAMRDVYGDVAVAVVHNGSDPAPLPEVVRERAVLTAGRLWDEGKGIAWLDAAAASLDAPVRAAGPVAGPNGAKIDVRHLALLGTLDARGMAAAYAGGAVYASMAVYEPFGLSVLEAAQAGMRLVLRDIPTFRELWDGAAAFVREPGELAGALREALDGEGDGGARERAGRFPGAAMVEGTLAVHRAVLTPSPSGRGLGEGPQAREAALASSPHPNPLPEGEGVWQ